MRRYCRGVREGSNSLRYAQYGICAGLMIVVLGIELGIRSFDVLFLLGISMLSTCLFGYAAEAASSSDTSLSLHFSGWVPCIGAWIILLRVHFLSPYSSAFASILVPLQALCFSAFGVVQFLQIRGGVFESYIHVEHAYTFLSIISKTSMAMLIFIKASDY